VAAGSLSVPPGAQVPLTSASPQSRAYLGTRTVLEHRSAAAEGAHSVMCVPLRARGTVLGVATFHRSLRSEPFEDDDLSLAEEVVAHAAVCIDNARRYANEHATALALQRSLLPHKFPANSAVEVAHAYLPSQGAVGGDWFDVIPLSGARVALVVGDVVGHGLHATATMGRLRTAVHNFAALDLSPDELLAHLDDLVNRLDEDVSEDGVGDGVIGATCLYAVYDPVSRRCTLASAGHPPPALVRSGGAVAFLDVPTGPPLGLGGFPFETVDVPLPEGSQLVLYTDGLFERRHRDPDQGLETLLRMLSGAHRPPRATCDAALAAIAPDGPQDDVAVLVAQTHALGPDQVTEWEVPPDPAAVGRRRGGGGRRGGRGGVGGKWRTTQNEHSELVTNALRHAVGQVRLRLVRDQALICEVSDGSNTYPRLRRSGGLDEDGRGLFLVAQFTQRWGTRHTAHGKVIWAEQALPTGK
jgi:serine phosphatase RsbU (regulator of sigma subunit)